MGGELKCFGDNYFNQLEVPSNIKFSSVSVKVGWDFSCGITMESEIGCWGVNTHSQTDVPQTLNLTNSIVSDVAIGLNHSCAT